MALAAPLVLSLGVVGCGDNGPGDSVLPGVQALVFVGRAFRQPGPDGVVGTNDDTHDVAGGSGQVIDYLRYTPGGGVFVLEPPTPDGTLRDLTESFEGVDVNGVDLSFDARQVVFTMRHAGDDRYHVYLANVDGTGDIRQLTFGDYNDSFPLFIPGDRIAFVTSEPYTQMGTRADEYNHSRVVTQIATISIDGGDADRRVCSQNLSHTSQPFLLSDGTIGFSRWEHLGPVNDVKLFRMNPDCSGMVAIAGQFNKPFNSLVQAQEIPGQPGQFVAIGTSRNRTIQAGAVIRVNARSQTSTDPALYMDVQDATFTNLTPLVPTGMESPPSAVGRYRHPRPLADREDFLVSWANGNVNDSNELAATAPNFGIYLWDPETDRRTLVYDDPNMWDLYAIPVATRDEPPVITPIIDAQPDPNMPAVIGSIDITDTSLPETVTGAQFDGVPLGDALADATHVRIIEGFSSEIGAVGQFGLTMHEGAAILGETPVYADGSWRAQVPAFLPYHLQPIDRFGLAIRNQMLWIQAMPGETRQCGGCHESRSHSTQPRMGPTTLAQQVGPDASTLRAIPERIELPWYGAASGGNVQDVFDRNCIQCHGGATNVLPGTYTVNVTTDAGEMLTYQIPYLDLTDRMLEVFYEDEVVSYPASYISTMYPSAMMGDSMAVGNVAPEWIVPGAARRSRLIEAMNVAAPDDPSALAWDPANRQVNVGAMHPEDQGVMMSAEDRRILIQAADLGGQYYSRRNVEGSDYWMAP